MNKKIIKLMIIAYVIILVVLPVIYYFYDNAKQSTGYSIDINLQQKTIRVDGDKYALKDIILNRKSMVINCTDKNNFIDNVAIDDSALTSLMLVDKNESYTEIKISFSASNTRDVKDLVKVEALYNIPKPIVTVNNNRVYLDENNVLNKTFGMKDSNLIIEVNYSRVSIKEKTLVVGSQLVSGLGKNIKSKSPYFIKQTKKVAVKAFELSGMFLRKVLEITFFILSSFFKLLISLIINLYNLVKSVVTVLFSSFMDIIKHLFRLENVGVAGNFFLKLLQVFVKIILFIINIFKLIFVSIFKVFSWFFISIYKIFSGIIGFIRNSYLYFFYDKPKVDSEKRIFINGLFNSNVFVVNSLAENLEFVVFAGDNKLLSNKKVEISVESKNKKNDSILVSKAFTKTDDKGHFSLAIKFGQYASSYTLTMIVNKQRIRLELFTVPGRPVKIVSLNKVGIKDAQAGKLLKKAFSMIVYDAFGNPVPSAVVEVAEKTISPDSRIKIAEFLTDDKGIVCFDYRMPEDAKRFFVIANIKDTGTNITYSMLSRPRSAENIEILGGEERQYVIGSKKQARFEVKISDKNSNPVPDVIVMYTLKNESDEQLLTKRVRTDKNGIASVVIDLPKRISGYSLVTGCDKYPDLEAGFAITIIPGLASRITMVSGNNQTIDWNKTASIPLKVLIVDSLGNPVSESDVVWNKSDNLGWIEKEDKTDTDGFARATIWAKQGKVKEASVIATAGKTKVIFRVYVKEPSLFKLYLKSSPIIKAVPAYKLPEDIVLVLRDQYGKVLPGKQIQCEYTVIRKGVTYQQYYNSKTNKQGIVTHNFVVSDQGDEINYKAKYFDGKKDIITWIKIDIIPEDISLLNVNPDSLNVPTGKKSIVPVLIYVADNNGRPVGGVYLDITLMAVPSKEKMKGKNYNQRIKTGKRGTAQFYPQVGLTAGTYTYVVRLGNNLYRNLKVRAIADEANKIVIKYPNKPMAVGSKTKAITFLAFDKNSNQIKQGDYYYGINKKKQILNNKLNKASLQGNEVGAMELEMPTKEGKYWVYVTDINHKASAFAPIKVKGTEIDKIQLLKQPEINSKEYIVGEKLNKAFPIKVTDKFGNPVPRVKISLDAYMIGSDKSELGVDLITDSKGEGRFELNLPKKSGWFVIKVYSANMESKNINFKIKLKNTQAKEVKIIEGDNQYVYTGSYLKKDFTLLLKDEFGNNVEDAVIKWVYPLKEKGETVYVDARSQTNVQGIATYNLMVEPEPGVREAKAFYYKGKKQESVSFYYKILSTKVGEIQLIEGKDLVLNGGQQCSRNTAVKIFDVNGEPIKDINVVYQIFVQDNKNTAMEVINNIYTNEQGIASYKIMAPVKKGEYEVVIFSKNTPSKKVICKLRVISDQSVLTHNITQTKEIALISVNQTEVTKNDNTIENIPTISEKEATLTSNSEINNILFKNKQLTYKEGKLRLFTKGKQQTLTIENLDKAEHYFTYRRNNKVMHGGKLVYGNGVYVLDIFPNYVAGKEEIEIEAKSGNLFGFPRYKLKIPLETLDSSRLRLKQLNNRQRVVTLNATVAFELELLGDIEGFDSIPFEVKVEEVKVKKSLVIKTDTLKTFLNMKTAYYFQFVNAGRYKIDFQSALSGHNLVYNVIVVERKKR